MPALGGNSGKGMWPWLLQRITGALLLIFVGLHFFITHFAAEGNIDFKVVTDRFMGTSFWFHWDWILLALALFHGVNGIRAIILDFGVKHTTARFLFWLMMVICVVTFIYGYWALSPFTSA